MDNLAMPSERMNNKSLANDSYIYGMSNGLGNICYSSLLTLRPVLSSAGEMPLISLPKMLLPGTIINTD
jgi:hypothetical protein